MKEISLPNGKVTLVDDEDHEALRSLKWSMNGRGYVSRHLPQKNRKRGFELMHRRIMGLVKGDHREIDHIDGNKLNNQRSNLRICNRAENNRNIGVRKNNKLGLKGVVSHRKNFQALIRVNGKTKYLGCFVTPEEAHEVYCLAADMLHGEFANYGG